MFFGIIPKPVGPPNEDYSSFWTPRIMIIPHFFANSVKHSKQIPSMHDRADFLILPPQY